MKNRNVTGIVVAVIYCIVIYGILVEAPPGEVPNNPPWAYLMIPLCILLLCGTLRKKISAIRGISSKWKHVAIPHEPHAHH
jgi:hypothetical protein